ncbi:MAG TPA: hypothetical protein VGN57_07400 [Pirellulaceae bacterium]|jgi:hypothetical protein|nr:hypothetical protein [Pirellulaceae bacterium]
MTAASTHEAAAPQPLSHEHASPPEVPADAAVVRKRRWGWAIVIVMGLATPLALLVAAYIVVVWSNERIAEGAIAKARAAGDPVSVADMEAYSPASPAIEEATAHWMRASEVIGGPAFNSSTTGVPFFDGSRPDDANEVLQPDELAIATAFLDRYREALDEAHAARRAGAVAWFPLEWQDGLAIQLTHVQNLRGVNRLLELDLEVKLAQGDVEGAVEDLLSMVATSEALSNEPILVSQLVRIACLGTATNALERTLRRHDLTDEQLARLQQAFARQHFHDGLRRAYRGEQFWAIHTMRVDGSSGIAEVDWAKKLPFNGADLSKTLEIWRPVIDASDQGMLEALAASQKMKEEVDAAADSTIDRLRYPMTLLMLPAVEASAKAFLRGEATARLAETAIACERYRLANGELPPKLDDLVPEFLPSVPADPFDRQPLRYVVSDSGALLYSIGIDQADDGGLEDPVDGDLPFELKGEKARPDEAPAEEVP